MRASATPILVALLVLSALPSCRRSGEADGKPKADQPAGLSQSYDSKDGALRIHYPPSFAAKNSDKGPLVLDRGLADGTDEAITLSFIDKPISNDVAEFARAFEGGATKHFDEWQETSQKSATCSGHPGILVSGTWVTKANKVKHLRQACHFIHNGHGYSFAYLVPESHAGADAPTLQQIVDGVDLLR